MLRFPTRRATASPRAFRRRHKRRYRRDANELICTIPFSSPPTEAPAPARRPAAPSTSRVRPAGRFAPSRSSRSTTSGCGPPPTRRSNECARASATPPRWPSRKSHRSPETRASTARLKSESACRTGRFWTRPPRPTAPADADLVVMATHGRTGLEHAILGSTTERVVRLSDVPVLTVRE